MSFISAVMHYFLSPLLIAHGFIPVLLSNLLFMVAVSSYHYLNFLGYDGKLKSTPQDIIVYFNFNEEYLGSKVGLSHLIWACQASTFRSFMVQAVPLDPYSKLTVIYQYMETRTSLAVSV